MNQESLISLSQILSEKTVNVAPVIDTHNVTYKNIVFSSNSTTCKVTFNGTANNSGDSLPFINSALEETGDYRVVIFGETDIQLVFVCRKNGTFVNTMTLNQNKTRAVSNVISLTTTDILYVTLQVVNGTTYNGEVFVMLIKDNEIPGSFINILTAKDDAARSRLKNVENKIQILSNINDKLDSNVYYGIRKKLSNNLNTGENSITPRLLYPQDNKEHYPGVRVVPDTDSPVYHLYNYKHEVYKGAQTGWQSVINLFPVIEESLTSFSFGFWINTSEFKDVFRKDNFFQLYFIDGSNTTYKFKIKVYPIRAIDNISTAAEFNSAESANIIDSIDVSAIILHEKDAYAYIRIDAKNIQYVADLDFTKLSNLRLYWQFDNVLNTMANKQLTFIGITFLKNNIIESGYYRYPDLYGLQQEPNEKSINERIDSIGSDSNNYPVKLIYNQNQYEDVIVQSKDGNTLVENYMVATYDHIDYNSTCHPTACFITVDGVRKQIFKSEDDGCPINLTSGYLAAGHGYASGSAITKTAHGKTYADIGSVWADTNGRNFYLLKIIDENKLGLFANSISTLTAYDMNREIPSGVLTHVSGAVHTDAISDYTVELWQIEPIVKSDGHVKKILMNGMDEITENGTYYGQFVDVIEEYDVAIPTSIIDSVISNKPSDGYTENPDYNKGASFMHFSNLYRFLSDGTLLIYSTVDGDVDLMLGYWGGTQYAEKNSANVYGGTCKKYLPGTLPISVNDVTYDMRIPTNMANWNTSLNYASEYWEDADYPPDRCVTFYTDSNDTIKAGYAVGYLPIALGSPAIRKTNISNALNLYSSKKYYPHLIDNRSIPAYTPLKSIVYRKPVINVADKHTSIYFIPCGDVCYMYADYHMITDDRIKVPTEYIGKPITVVKSTDNVIIYEGIVTNEIRIRVIESTANYGYAVLKIG